MSATDGASPLQRKLAPPRSSWTMLHPVERLCREEMPRRAEDRLGMEAEVVSVTLDYLARGALVDVLADDHLMFLYSADKGPVGVVSADAELLAALIEIQMLGRVLAFNRPEHKPTTTDAVIARGMLSEWVESISEHLPMPGEAMLGGRVTDTRAARLTLDDGHFRVLTVTLSVGGGQRQGQLLIACPEIVTAGNRAGPSQHALLRRHLDTIDTPFRAELARIPFAISDVPSLAEGDMLDLPEDAMMDVALVAPRGEVLATASLGKLGRRRAVRLNRPGAAPASTEAARKIMETAVQAAEAGASEEDQPKDDG